MAKSSIQSLQVFRGFAALSVVAHHAGLSTEAFVGTMPTAVSELLVFGLLGVDFFFVLSGFIIMYAHFDDERGTTTVKRYAFKRLTRIFPAYWPVGLGLLVLYASLPGLSAGGGREYSWVSSLLLVPANGPPALSVAWTLVHELLFYGIFMLFFVSRRGLVVALLAWAVLILVANQFFSPSGWLRYPLSFLNIEFMLGVGAALLVRSEAVERKGKGAALLGGTMACFALWLMATEIGVWPRLLFALGLALVIVGFAVREQTVVLRWPVSMLILGNASYSIYLVHNPLLSLTQRVAGVLAMSWPIAMLMGVTLSVAAGWAYHRLVEAPALRWFRSHTPLDPKAPTKPLRV